MSVCDQFEVKQHEAARRNIQRSKSPRIDENLTPVVSLENIVIQQQSSFVAVVESVLDLDEISFNFVNLLLYFCLGFKNKNKKHDFLNNFTPILKDASGPLVLKKEAWESDNPDPVSKINNTDKKMIKRIGTNICKLGFHTVLKVVVADLKCEGIAGTKEISEEELTQLFLLESDKSQSGKADATAELSSDPQQRLDARNKRDFFNASNAVWEGRWKKIPEKEEPTVDDVARYLKSKHSAYSWSQANLALVLCQAMFMKVFHTRMFSDSIYLRDCSDGVTGLIPEAVTPESWRDVEASDQPLCSRYEVYEGLVEQVCGYFVEALSSDPLKTLMDMAKSMPSSNRSDLTLSLLKYLETNHGAFVNHMEEWKEDWNRKRCEENMRISQENFKRNALEIAKLPSRQFTEEERLERRRQHEKDLKYLQLGKDILQRLEAEFEEEKRVRLETAMKRANSLAF